MIILDMEGRLVAGTGVEILHDVIDELLAEGWKKILLNLTEVRRIDSSGVGEVVASSRLAAGLGATLKVLQGDGRVRHVLHISHVLPLLDVRESEAEALAAFADA